MAICWHLRLAGHRLVGQGGPLAASHIAIIRRAKSGQLAIQLPCGFIIALSSGPSSSSAWPNRGDHVKGGIALASGRRGGVGGKLGC